MIGVAAVTKSLLPALIAGHGQIIVIGSTAGQVAYEGGGGYVAAKHAVKAVWTPCGWSCSTSPSG